MLRFICTCAQPIRFFWLVCKSFVVFPRLNANSSSGRENSPGQYACGPCWEGKCVCVIVKSFLCIYWRACVWRVVDSVLLDFFGKYPPGCNIISPSQPVHSLPHNNASLYLRHVGLHGYAFCSPSQTAALNLTTASCSAVVDRRRRRPIAK